jgi:hypothetical protein
MNNEKQGKGAMKTTVLTKLAPQRFFHFSLLLLCSFACAPGPPDRSQSDARHEGEVH